MKMKASKEDESMEGGKEVGRRRRRKWNPNFVGSCLV